MANGTPAPSRLGAASDTPAPDATGATTEATAPVAAPPPLPEVRQCQVEDDPLYGCSAIKSALPLFAWGIFNPMTGAHWEENDARVQDWKVLS